MSRPMLIAACPRCVLGVCVLRLLLISQERLRGTGTRSLRLADPFRGACLVVKTSIALAACSVCHVAMLSSVACTLMLAVFRRSYIDARVCDVCVCSVLLVEGLLESDTCQSTKDVRYALTSILSPHRDVRHRRKYVLGVWWRR
jgi:hypothetical protein